MPDFNSRPYESLGPPYEALRFFATASDHSVPSDRGIPDIVPIPVPEGRGLPPDPEKPVIVPDAGEHVAIPADSGPRHTEITERMPQQPASVAPESQPAGAGVDIRPEQSSEVSDPARDLAIPEDIDYVLDAELIPSGLPGDDTKKFYVQGRPDLFVRLNEGLILEDVQAAHQAFSRLGRRIDVLPVHAEELGGEVYVVTKRVEGVSLADALENNPTPDFLDAVDATWAGLCNDIASCLPTNDIIPSDIQGPNQFMVGTVAGDPEPKIWLVDIPYYGFRAEDGGTYERELLMTANGIGEIEAQIGQRMPAARAALEHALTFARDSPYWGDGLAHAARYVLEHGRLLFPATYDDDHALIQQLRTR